MATAAVVLEAPETMNLLGLLLRSILERNLAELGQLVGREGRYARLVAEVDTSLETWLQTVGVPASSAMASDDPVAAQDILDASQSQSAYATLTSDVYRLSMVLQNDGQTTWVAERLIKERQDIDIVAAHAPVPRCDRTEVRSAAEAIGDRGIVRGAVPGFAVCGQPGCWHERTAAGSGASVRHHPPPEHAAGAAPGA